MYYKDHAPPHFHAIYTQYDSEISIDPVKILAGPLPRRTQSLIYEWAAMYQPELRENWNLARAGLPLRKIPPLE